MKSNFYLPLAAMVAFFLCSHVQATPPGSGWTMTFDVEFNTMPAICSSKTQPTPGLLPTDSWNSRKYTNEQEYYCFPGFDAYNPFSITTGSEGIKCLNITLIKTPANVNANGQPFVSGMMSTGAGSNYNGELRSTTPFGQKYGYFEMRAKLPSDQGQGYWSGFFMMPYNPGDPNTNSTNTEYDIFEVIGNHPTISNQTIHWNKYANSSSTAYNGVNTATGFHTYGFQWDSANVRWYVDGVLTKTFANQWNEPMYMIWGQAIGGTWPGMANASTIVPGVMQVEYVRAYANGSVNTSSSSPTGTRAQTIPNFPATLNLTTNQTPYTLIGTTSGGLPITYTVVSGPGNDSGTALTLTGAGTIVLKASNPGNPTYAPVSATETITVTAPTQTQTVANFPSTLSLTTANSPHTLPTSTSAGLTITYSVTSGPATVTGNSLALTGAGTVVLKATQAGNSTYSALSTTETITVTFPNSSVSLVAQTIPNFPATRSLTTADSPYALTATTSGNLAVYYTIVSGPATVSGDTLRLTGTGTVVVSGTQSGNGTYFSVTARETVTVTTPPVAAKIVQTVFNFPATLALTTADTPYSLRSTTSAGLPITYTVVSGPATVTGATLDLNGTTGTVVLKGTQAGNATYASFSATETITVTAPKIVQAIFNFPDTLALTTNQTPFTLRPKTTANLPIIYNVLSGPATVAGSTLKLTGALGTVVLQAKQAGNALYAPLSITETISVAAAGRSAALRTPATIAAPATMTLSMNTPTTSLAAMSATGVPITYSIVSGPATISGNSLTATGAGTVIVKAVQGDASSTQTITVTPAATKTFKEWEAMPGHFTHAQMLNATITGPTATPQKDSVPNLLKYLYNIDPTGRMSAADYAAMPVTDTDTTTTPGTTYLTLTYRRYAYVTGIKVNVQISKNLQTWTTVVPNVNRQVGTDPKTGDPIMLVEVNTKGATSEFIRLNVTSP